ncbi:glycogen debranching protein GlgX [Streptomyces sp. NPDC002795]|uniref:glycogen debranching protein GlgX n=1 Tax=Streptomyces sp. NPDC002795 TaxID=3364665 RepID=UPI003689A008
MTARPAGSTRVRSGRPYPLGATYDGHGTNFALFSAVADQVDLVLLDTDGSERTVTLPEVYGSVWHGYVPHTGPPQQYGYRIHGPWEPASGHRCDAGAFLLDPYAKAVHDRADTAGAGGQGLCSVVVDPAFDWSGDEPPDHAYADSVIYEAHVRGLTAGHPAVPKALRGTYAGLATPAVLDHLTALKVTAVELLPVHQFVQDGFLRDRGLSNYWGYNTIGFFAPHHAYAAHGTLGEQVTEFKSMVKSLHAAGLEVILDVVYNHTAEGNENGPTLSFRGIDNASYYRLADHDFSRYYDTTGTGNSLLMRHPNVLQLLMDSLRYWVTECHVDGFRFDLAATLARQFHEVDRLSAFFDLVQQDPVISRVKLIAEPWDLGEGGYQVGNFPPLWSEWNGKYRDCVRDVWRAQEGVLPEFASRLTGSADLYQHDRRRPRASINFVTAHDGFTLRDLVSYDEKHNEDNGEHNNDGENDNRSWNCGAEGPTDDPGVRALRARQQRNLLATLVLSQGIPMLSHGDELGRTQRGNNNAYCQDNELTWVDWNLDDERASLLAFTRDLIELRSTHPVLRQRRFFRGEAATGHHDSLPDLVWLRPDATEMADEDWNRTDAHALAVFLNGDEIAGRGSSGERVIDDSFLILFNFYWAPMEFRLPDASYGASWAPRIDTAESDGVSDESEYKAEATVRLEAHSLVVLTHPSEAAATRPSPGSTPRP